MSIQDTLGGFQYVMSNALNAVVPGRTVPVYTEIPQVPYMGVYPYVLVMERDQYVNRSDSGKIGKLKGNPDRAHDNIYAVEYAALPFTEAMLNTKTGLSDQQKAMRADIEALAVTWTSHNNQIMLLPGQVVGLVAVSGDRFEFRYGDRGPFIISLNKPCIGCRGIISVTEHNRNQLP